MRRNWRKIYGGINIKVRVLADFLAIVLVLPKNFGLLLEILTNQSSVTAKFPNSPYQRRRDLWQRKPLPLVSYVNETVNFPTLGTQTPNCYFLLATRNVISYTVVVIKDFKHKGLEKFFLTGSKAGIQATHANKLRLILGRLNASTSPRDMNLPGFSLHELKGDRQSTWSVKVSGNWRVTFRFDGLDVTVVNYEDYH